MISFSEDDGSSFDSAVKILGASDTQTGIAAEFKYIASKYGVEGEDWTFVFQRLHHEFDKHFDEIQISLSNKKIITTFFDISDFFGKYKF